MSDLFSNLEEKSDLSIAGLHADWQDIVQDFLQAATGQSLQKFLQERRAANAIIYPPEPLKALSLTALQDVRIVILGQDPYHGAGQAEGLAFSVAQGVKIPPSLRNMFKERERDLGIPPAAHGSLMNWAAQGILLLNTTLTVEDGLPASHAKKGWEQLTDKIIEACAKKASPVAFLLWGGHAQAKQELIQKHNTDQRHLILKANHPSPLSALRPPEPFIGCGHFKAARQFIGDNTLFS
ncbi:uracil-DNA glycosylase [Variovorax sp. PCZ-1]|uniref:uracil-DNA glycosylase n=1 Tax=Variovorax sp. PCZ-1 TaxID=2835533 RepID=UPI001BD1B59A|nr:uracil-DNA glycosylase [Variovorax sp. PCZ-1]MBS7806041.1 uracil-DNA glycosylase [Variovorax sp. PCZ-1]